MLVAKYEEQNESKSDIVRAFKNLQSLEPDRTRNEIPLFLMQHEQHHS